MILGHRETHWLNARKAFVPPAPGTPPEPTPESTRMFPRTCPPKNSGRSPAISPCRGFRNPHPPLRVSEASEFVVLTWESRHAVKIFLQGRDLHFLAGEFPGVEVADGDHAHQPIVLVEHRQVADAF